jgi:hypothetical protein
MAKIAKRRGKWVVDWYDPVTKKRSGAVCVDRDATKRRLGDVLKAGERIGASPRSGSTATSGLSI